MKRKTRILTSILMCVTLLLAFATVSASADEEQASLTVKTGGNGTGQIAHADPGEELEFIEDMPMHYSYSIITGEHKIAAKADEDSVFEYWQAADGSVYSTDEETTVELADESIELTAIFKIVPSQTATMTLHNGTKKENLSELESFGVIYTLMMAGELEEAPSPEGMETFQIYNDKDGKEVFMYEETTARYAYADDYHDISCEITDELRAAMQKDLDENADQYSEEQKEVIQDLIDYYKTVELTFGPIHYLHIGTDGSGIGWITYNFEEFDLSYDEEDLDMDAYIPYIGTYKVGALPAEDAVFVKWIKDGEDYSTDPEITVDMYDEDVDLIAVFEAVPPVIDDEEETPTAGTEEPAAKDDSVKTGDETNTLPAALALTGSALVLAGYLFGRRRKGQQQ